MDFIDYDKETGLPLAVAYKIFEECKPKLKNFKGKTIIFGNPGELITPLNYFYDTDIYP